MSEEEKKDDIVEEDEPAGELVDEPSEPVEEDSEDNNFEILETKKERR